jgi:hypothetical protein
MTELHMTGTQYNIVLMIFFVPYILLEVPSNIILKKVKPSTWLSGLMFFWGQIPRCKPPDFDTDVECRHLDDVPWIGQKLRSARRLPYIPGNFRSWSLSWVRIPDWHVL